MEIHDIAYFDGEYRKYICDKNKYWLFWLELPVGQGSNLSMEICWNLVLGYKLIDYDWFFLGQVF